MVLDLAIVLAIFFFIVWNGIDLGNFAVSSGVTCYLVTAVNGSLWWVCFENRPKPLVVLVFEYRTNGQKSY